jgi:hypothetical protein
MDHVLVVQLKSMLVSVMTLAAVLHVEGTKVYAVVSRPDVAMTVSWGTSKKSKAEGITGDSNLDFLRVSVHRDEWQRHVQERASLQQHVPVSWMSPNCCCRLQLGRHSNCCPCLFLRSCSLSCNEAALCGPHILQLSHSCLAAASVMSSQDPL